MKGRDTPPWCTAWPQGCLSLTDCPIYAPLILDDPTVAKALRSQTKLAEALSRYDRVDITAVPIGSWQPPQSELYDNLTDEERRQLIDAGVCADTSTVMLDTIR